MGGAKTNNINRRCADGSIKQVLGLVGSPRRLGNCEVFVKEIARSMPGLLDLKLIRLPSLNIKPCLACYGCVMDQPCPHKDDMEPLLQRIVEADAIIVAAPVYFFGAHSIFKTILDRGFLFYKFLEATHGKPCVLVNLYGMKDRIGVAPHTLLSFASFLGLDIRASVNIKAALPGEVATHPRARDRAKKLARVLAGDEPPMKGGGCPFCGNTIVRMEKYRFICAVCHGSFLINDRGKKIKLKEGGIFGTSQHMLLHKTWLRGMKKEFLKKRKEILTLTLPYKDQGEWIRF